MYKNESENKAMEVRIPHPDFGEVVFTEPTARQLDVLEDYLKCKKLFKLEDGKPKYKLNAKRNK